MRAIVRWLRRQYHAWMVASWETEIDRARHVQDWTGLDRAISERDRHQWLECEAMTK